MSTAGSTTLLAHEWLAPHGGSENVFEQIAKTFPGAALQCLWNDAPERFGSTVPETWLARSPLRRSKALSLPFMSYAWKKVDLAPFGRVVASSHAFGHQLATSAASQGKEAFAYVHTPARYIWTPEFDERGQGRARRAAAGALQRRDRARTSEAVAYAANSEFIRSRISDAWHRDATVIYPPAAIERIQAGGDWSSALEGAEADLFATLPDAFVLGASRLIDYKRLDLAMKTGEALDQPVVIAGSGPSEAELRKFAETVAVPVIFAGRVSDQLLYALYERALLFVFMAVEDFGIMPVEAMASGTPVLVNTEGGASESVRLLDGGATVDEDARPGELREAAARALEVDMPNAAARSASFGETAFRDNIRRWVDSS